jgi:exosortase
LDRAGVRRDLCFVLLVFLSLLLFWNPVRTLIQYSLEHEHYSHIVLIPFVTMGLICLERKTIFSTVRSSYGLGAALLLGGGVLYGFAQRQIGSWSQNDSLSAAIFSLVLIWLGAFLCCYGREAFRAARFPLLLLFFAVPIPDFVLASTISVLQKGSAEVAFGLFKLTGVPIYREGFLFSLPSLTIEVAEECSGIRSSLALLITSLLAGHLFLRSGWRKLGLSLAVLPIALFKNAARIVTISLLSIYVDRGFLTGTLHRRGGILFFLLSLSILALVLRLLQRSESVKARVVDSLEV